jgi:hypothetical protein
MRFVIIFLGGCAGAVVLQVFLSGKENRWLGLILPLITFLNSLVYTLNVVSFGDTANAIGTMCVAFLLANIPTAVLLVIYFACREKFKRKRSLDKMSAQDLE